MNDEIIPSGWSISKLGDYTIDMRSGLSRKLNDEDIGIPVIRSNNIIDNKIDCTDIKYWYLIDPQGADIENYCLNDGDILVNFINSISQIGKAALYKNRIGRDVIFTTNILKITFNGRLNSSYFIYFSQTEKYYQYVKSITKPAINQASFTTVEYKKMNLLVPPLEEQEKIVQILYTWDKVIELKEKFIEEKKTQKSGLMQKLLTGKVRIPGFDGEWEDTQLKDHFGRVTRKNTDLCPNVLTISAQKGLVSQEDYFNKSVASSILDNYFLLKTGEFAYNKSYSNGYPMGAIKRLNYYDEGVVTALYICFHIKNSEKSDGDYFEHYFDSGLLNTALTQIAHEGGRAHGLLNVSPKDFFDLKVIVPACNEQKAIASILNTAKLEIDLHEKELKWLKLQKKGLMQLLLTGIVRVNTGTN